MSVELERYYSPSAIAASWGVSEKTVYRKFREMDGVLKIPQRVLLSKRRRAPKVMLRIPASLLRRTEEEWSRGFGVRV